MAHLDIKTGYKKGVDGLEIDPVQAAVVKLIFTLRVSGKSLGCIAKELEARNIPTPTGKAIWSREAINKLLKNEGEKERVLIRNNHALIIEDVVFEQVNR